MNFGACAAVAYFRDIEDAARGDECKGTRKLLPVGELVMHNQTKGTTTTLPMASSLASKQANSSSTASVEPLAHALPRGLTRLHALRSTKIATHCERIRDALLYTAMFKARRVDYYLQSWYPRWALRENIATWKLVRRSARMRSLYPLDPPGSYHFIFSLTYALGFQKVITVRRVYRFSVRCLVFQFLR